MGATRLELFCSIQGHGPVSKSRKIFGDPLKGMDLCFFLLTGIFFLASVLRSLLLGFLSKIFEVPCRKPKRRKQGAIPALNRSLKGRDSCACSMESWPRSCQEGVAKRDKATQMGMGPNQGARIWAAGL